MAKIVLGLGTSHTPMLLASDETLLRFRETDEKIKHRDKEGRPTTYAELLEKADPQMAEMVKPAELAARQNKARDATARSRPRRPRRRARRPRRGRRGRPATARRRWATPPRRS